MSSTGAAADSEDVRDSAMRERTRRELASVRVDMARLPDSSEDDYQPAGIKVEQTFLSAVVARMFAVLYRIGQTGMSVPPFNSDGYFNALTIVRTL